MSTLIITAHPSSSGFTHKIANKYKKTLDSIEEDCEIINLYDKQNNLDYLKFEERKNFPIDSKIKNFQKKIKDSDELIFIFPVWNSAEPAILKNFYDRVFTARFAFHYVNGKAVGLLNGKKAVLFITCDSSKYLYRLIGNPLRKIWYYGRMRFCGIKIRNYIEFDKMRLQSEVDLQKRLKKVEKIAKNY